MCVLTGDLQRGLDGLGATVEEDDMIEVSGKDLDEPRGEVERGGCGSDEGRWWEAGEAAGWRHQSGVLPCSPH